MNLGQWYTLSDLGFSDSLEPLGWGQAQPGNGDYTRSLADSDVAHGKSSLLCPEAVLCVPYVPVRTAKGFRTGKGSSNAT